MSKTKFDKVEDVSDGFTVYSFKDTEGGRDHLSVGAGPNDTLSAGMIWSKCPTSALVAMLRYRIDTMTDDLVPEWCRRDLMRVLAAWPGEGGRDLP